MKETIEKSLQDFDKKLDDFIKSSNEEATTNAKLGRENKSKLESLNSEAEELREKVSEIEQKMASRSTDTPEYQTMGQELTKSSDYEGFVGGKASKMTYEVKNTLLGTSDTVAPDRQPAIISGASRSLRVINTMPNLPTSSNAVEYTRENVVTLNAAEVAEGGALPETSITYELISAPVRSVGHWIKLSKEVIEDAPALAAHVDSRLIYGAQLRLDYQVLNGDGTGNNLGGLALSGHHTVFTPTADEKAIASVRRAMGQVENSEYMPSAVYMNSSDVVALDLETGSDEHYLAGNPRFVVSASVWGLPVVKTNAVASGKFFVGAFDLATAINMRKGVAVEMSESDGDNFTSNLVTVKATLRAALSNYRPAAVAYGSLTA
ncbi:phage major capsid protein [Microbulbifer sp. VVAC002]|uniref:phage major capsid protein n=1 Tax=Microbulbifer sp. VVAC002 TaxID=3243387 RepID=UPI004039668A